MAYHFRRRDGSIGGVSFLAGGSMLLMRSVLLAILIIIGSLVSSASAEDRDLAFVHALQSRHYGDTAIEFLQAAKSRPDASAEIRDLWDLEMSKSLREQAQTISDFQARDKLLKDAQNYLNAFAKEKPNHPEALQAQLTNAGMILDQASELLWAARGLQGDEKKAKFAEARKLFDESARPLLKETVKSLNERIAKLGAPPRGPRERLPKKQRDLFDAYGRLVVDLIQAKGRLCLIDYYIAQTYTAKEDDGKRRKALNVARAALDAIFQEYRDRDPNSADGRFAIEAHAWTGRIDDELGNSESAKEVYDEVLSNFQELGKDAKSVFPTDNARESQHYIKTDIDDILARTKHFALLLLAKDPKQQKEYLTQARDFVENEEYKKNLKGEWGYQGAALELAKRLAADAEKDTKTSEQGKLTREALKIVSDLATMRGEFQREAIELRNKLGSGGAENPQTTDEAMELARIAQSKKQWDHVGKWLAKAQELEEAKGAKKDPAQLSQIQELLASNAMQSISDDYNQAKEKNQFTKEKWMAWIEGAEKVARDYKKTLVAERSMGFALDCARQLHQTAVEAEKAATAKRDANGAKAAAADREDALKRLKDAVDFTVKTYPGTAEADRARMSLAWLNFVDAKYTEALAVYEAVEPSSEEYARAADMAGRAHYMRYLLEKQKSDKDRNAQQMEDDRQKAIQHFTKSIAKVEASKKANDEVPASYLETVLVLAKIHLSAGENKEAQAVVEPIVKALSQQKPSQLDPTMLDIFNAALRADLGLNEFKKAQEVGATLMEIGPDERNVNAALVSLVQRLDADRRTVEKTLATLPVDINPADAQKIRDNLAAIKATLSDMLAKIADRKQMSLQTMVYLGNLFSDIDLPNEAEKQYGGVLEKANADPEFTKNKDNAKLVNAVRARQVSLLRVRGKYREAIDEANKLCAAFPNALDPLVERAKIYQDWSMKDPTKYDDAITAWSEIRRRLERQVPSGDSRSKAASEQQRALEQSYYAAVYNIADCLLKQASRLQGAGDKKGAASKALLGEQVLNSVFQKFPKLDGTEATMKTFTAIKAKLAAFRGVQTPATALH
jgi:hypothetical protein